MRVCVYVLCPSTNSPRLFVLAAIMEVHEDFFVYKNGIYKHTDASFTKPPQYRKHGTHSVRITG